MTLTFALLQSLGSKLTWQLITATHDVHLTNDLITSTPSYVNHVNHITQQIYGHNYGQIVLLYGITDL